MTDDDTITLSRADVARLEHLAERAEEAALDAQRVLAAEDYGWELISRLNDGETLPREDVKKAARLARVMATADPLIRRAVSLAVAYVWGGGCAVQAAQEDSAEQDVNAVVQAFYADPANAATFTSEQARQERERKLRHTGETFHALFTAPLTGNVQIREIPASQIVDRITDPEDDADVWFWKREWFATATTAQGGRTVTVRESRTLLYPDVNFRPARRPRSVDGVDVAWDAPVVHTKVNPSGGRGTPDLLPALPWARGYKEFLEDWARYMRAVSRFAWKATAKTTPGAAKARAAIATGGEHGTVGQTAIVGVGQDITPALKSGATLDAESGKPLAAMVAAATDVPLTMLLGDPGQTGARAVAETLTPAFENPIRMRQRLHADLERTVVEYVIREAVRAAQGPLKGTIRRDPWTGREQVELRGRQSIQVLVEFPRLSQVDVKTMVDAIATADGIDLVPPLVLARMLLVALEVDDVDAVLETLVDANGNFIAPSLSTAAAAGERAVQAARDGKPLNQPAA